MGVKSVETFRCDRCGASVEKLNELYEFKICASCESKIGLYKDQTIEKHIRNFEIAKSKDPQHPTYAEDVEDKLAALEYEYVGKKIKLLHIRDRIKNLKN